MLKLVAVLGPHRAAPSRAAWDAAGARREICEEQAHSDRQCAGRASEPPPLPQGTLSCHVLSHSALLLPTAGDKRGTDGADPVLLLLLGAPAYHSPAFSHWEQQKC